MVNSFTIKQLMLLYCNTEDQVRLQVRMQHRFSHASPGLPAPVLSGSMSSSVVLLSSKSVVPRVHGVNTGVSPTGHRRCCAAVETLQSLFVTDGRKLLLYEPLDIHHFLQGHKETMIRMRHKEQLQILS